jgi:hypothetical protein
LLATYILPNADALFIVNTGFLTVYFIIFSGFSAGFFGQKVEYLISEKSAGETEAGD